MPDHELVDQTNAIQRQVAYLVVALGEKIVELRETLREQTARIEGMETVVRELNDVVGEKNGT
jgi:hypothetical protein